VAGLVAVALMGAIVGCGDKEPDDSGTEGLSAEQRFEEGNDYYQQGNLDNAASSFEAALKLEPRHLGSLTNLGVVYYQLGRLEDAVGQFEAGLEVDSSDAQLHYLLGAARLQQSRYEDAERSFLQAKGLQPDLPEVHFGLGALYKLQGKTDEAIAAFERFLELGPAQDPRASEEAERELLELRGQ